jgi:protein-L-isoaspartate(D-aspartate) O-methyltransferase
VQTDPSHGSDGVTTVDYSKTRFNMVESQLRTNKVTSDQLLEAFEEIPRERFVPGALKGIAYVDEDLEIAPGRFLMEPRVLARLIQAADPGVDDVVLDLGCGTGYATAILARLSATVVAVEEDPALAERANEVLTGLEVDNAVVIEGRLADGYPKQAPYNVILINGAVGQVPANITDQLADGGRLVTVVKDSQAMGRAVLMQRTGESVSSRVLFDAAVPLLPEFRVEPGFVF